MNFQIAKERLLQIAVDGDYTPLQVRDVTFSQVVSQLNMSEGTISWIENNIGFFNNVKEAVAKEFEDNILMSNISQVWQEVLAAYPDAEKQVNKRQKKVIIYLGES